MKVVIWFFAIFIFALVETGLKYAGFTLGVISTILLAWLCYLPIAPLCKAWDSYKASRKTEEETTMPVETSRCEKMVESKPIPWKKVVLCTTIGVLFVALVCVVVQVQKLEGELAQMQSEYELAEADMEAQISQLKNTNATLERELASAQNAAGDFDNTSFADGYIIGYFRAMEGDGVIPDMGETLRVPSAYQAWLDRQESSELVQYILIDTLKKCPKESLN